MFDLFEEGIIARVFVHVFFCAFALALLFLMQMMLFTQQNYFQSSRLVSIHTFISLFLSLSLVVVVTLATKTMVAATVVH